MRTRLIVVFGLVAVLVAIVAVALMDPRTMENLNAPGAEVAAEPAKPAPDVEGAVAKMTEIMTSANTAAGIRLFRNATVSSGGGVHVLKVVVSDEWYRAQPHEQERLYKVMAEAFENVAKQHHLDTPFTRFEDVTGKKVAG